MVVNFEEEPRNVERCPKIVGLLVLEPLPAEH